LIEEPKSEPVRPKIGDSRPAPVMPASTSQGAPSSNAPSSNAPSNKSNSNGQGASAQSGAQSDGTSPSGAAKKRRKRGGRGRSRTGGAGGAQGVSAATGAVNADLGPASDLDDLDEAVRERRRGRSRQGRATGRYTMGVHKAADGGVHLAVLEGRVLTEHYVSRETDDDTSIDGNIYLGRVQNVLPGMEAAFIDISTPKNGVLYRGDVSFDAGEVENQEPRIESLLKNGQMVIVQVTKNPIGAKGARLTQEVSLAGRFVVMVPGQPQTYGISKRLPDEERRRLRKVLDAIRPDDAGLIVRTAAAGASAEELERDLNRLKAEWQVIAAAAKRSGKPCLLHREPALVVRVIREEFNTEYRSIVIDDEVLYNEVRSYVEAIAPELAERVELHVDAPGELPLFERLHIHEQLHKALERKVWLPSGGSLIIERTEALTVIDVNTGKNVGRSNLEETVFQNNLEAAAEVAHQLRLRDIGGIIVIDFIDMEVKRNRDEVVRVLRDALARDKTRTQVFEISELGLVEMTRKRISEGLVESFSEVCPTCAGRGFTVDQSML
ncbi:MAG: Rne/Rng family ribonuclease, partial [Acidimicrobiia bacterium]|nr:Rne/Rng family ribonuclease [Acidimicrobiia bacterium]